MSLTSGFPRAWKPPGWLSSDPRPRVEVTLTCAHLSLQTKPVDPTVDGGAQVQQVVNIECVSDFTEAPVLNIQFR